MCEGTLHMESVRDQGQAKQSITVKYSYMDKIGFFLYGLYFVLTPFYFWSSGLPQVADVVMVIAVAWFWLGRRLRLRYPKQAKRFLLVGLLFVFYVMAANLVWMSILSSLQMARVSLFYVYNFLIAAMVVFMYGEHGSKLYEVTFQATLLSVVTQFFLFAVGGGFTGGRMVAFFNNPNQLGYYSLMVASIMIFLSTKITVKSSSLSLGLGAGSMLVFASLS